MSRQEGRTPLPRGCAVPANGLTPLLRAENHFVSKYLKDRGGGEGCDAEDTSHARERRAKGDAEVQLHPAAGQVS